MGLTWKQTVLSAGHGLVRTDSEDAAEKMRAGSVWPARRDDERVIILETIELSAGGETNGAFRVACKPYRLDSAA